MIPVYTLGVNGAKVINIPGYENNYWAKYTTEAMLKRLLFFRLYEYFPDSRIFPAAEPFVGSIFFQNHPIYVYVSKMDTQDLMMYLKGREFGERIIIISESFDHLKPLELSKELKLRVATENDLRAHCMEELLYGQTLEGNWEKKARKEVLDTN